MRIPVVAVLIIISFQARSQYYTPPPMPPLPMHQHYNNPYFYNNVKRFPKTAVERVSRKHDFVIVFKDSTQQIRQAKLDEYKNSYFLAINLRDEVRSIKPEQTLSLSTLDKKNNIVYIGLPADSCWLFKIEQGEINLYSFLAEDDEKFIIAMQKGNDGPILPITQQNVEAIIERNHIAYSLVMKKDLVAALKMHNRLLK